MIISKHTHSCLLIKEKRKVILIDPGNYTSEDDALRLEDIHQLDYLLITHEHVDHLYIPFVKELTNKFVNLQIISNSSVANLLYKEDILAKTQGNTFIEVIDAPHEHVFAAPQFQNNLFNVFSTLTHPGDNLSFKETCKILALPVQAPWGSLTQAVEKAIEVKPEYIIPIHDWHWSDKARSAFYSRLNEYFAQNGIKFLGLQNGEDFEI